MNSYPKTHTIIKSLMVCSLLAAPLTYATDDVQQKTAKSVDKVLSLTKASESKGIEHKGNAPKVSRTPAQKTDKTTAVDSSNSNNNNHDVWFDTIDINLYEDANHNGYYNRIVVDFDADTQWEHIDVYAVMSLTDQNGITSDYYTTDDFALYTDSYNDRHQVDTVLTANWITGSYDLSIHLYDAYNGELVAHVDKYDAPQLSFLTLESIDYELTHEQFLSVYSKKLWLNHDNDDDGFYSSFKIDLDLDVNWGSKNVYAELYISTDQFNWQPLYTSEPFNIIEDDTQDTRHWNFDLNSGYAPGYYYIKILVIDTNNHSTLLQLSSQDYDALYAIPLEDSSFEINNTTPLPEQPLPQPPTNKSSVSSESGGSMGSISSMLMISLIVLRRRINS
jgi:hypothetical protein